MQITTRTQGFELSDAIQSFVRNRLHVALKRLSYQVIAIDVFARDTNGPKGGIDKQVLIRVQLPNRQTVTIDTVHENLYAAIEKGAKRTKRAVRRHLRKAQHIEKRRLRDLPRDNYLESIHGA
jgi:ribosomal subunit interface protein